ncbi:MAG: uridine kinase [Actinomycetota bacterium]
MSGSPEAVCIAIDGHSAAGKSTLADRLSGIFDVALVRVDDFYSVMEEEVRARLSPREGVESYFDWKRMRDQALIPLLDGRPAAYQPYDWHTNVLHPQATTVEPAPLVVVEGLFAARPELMDLISLTVLVEVDPEIRMERQAERDDEAIWVQRWDEAERYYFDNIRPAATFDIRVVGDAQHH